MDHFLINIGKKRTILISIAILAISLYLIAFFMYLISKNDLFYTFLIRDIILQILVFISLIMLLIFVLKGKKWACNTLIIFLFIKAYFSLEYIAYIEAVKPNTHTLNTTYLSIQIIIYSTAIIHFGFSKSFIAFSKYKNIK